MAADRKPAQEGRWVFVTGKQTRALAEVRKFLVTNLSPSREWTPRFRAMERLLDAYEAAPEPEREWDRSMLTQRLQSRIVGPWTDEVRRDPAHPEGGES